PLGGQAHLDVVVRATPEEVDLDGLRVVRVLDVDVDADRLPEVCRGWHVEAHNRHVVCAHRHDLRGRAGPPVWRRDRQPDGVVPVGRVPVIRVLDSGKFPLTWENLGREGQMKPMSRGDTRHYRHAHSPKSHLARPNINTYQRTKI